MISGTSLPLPPNFGEQRQRKNLINKYSSVKSTNQMNWPMNEKKFIKWLDKRKNDKNKWPVNVVGSLRSLLVTK